MAKNESITVRLDKDQKGKLIRMAKRDRRGLSDFLRLLLSDVVNRKIDIGEQYYRD